MSLEFHRVNFLNAEFRTSIFFMCNSMLAWIQSTSAVKRTWILYLRVDENISQQSALDHLGPFRS